MAAPAETWHVSQLPRPHWLLSLAAKPVNNQQFDPVISVPRAYFTTQQSAVSLTNGFRNVKE
jgi:hypothetical protein